MPLTMTISKIVADGSDCTVYFNLVPSGSYATGGDALNFQTATQDATFLGMVPYYQLSDQAPVNVTVWNADGDLTYSPVVNVPAAPTQSNIKVLFVTNGGSTQLSAGAYPSQITKLQGSAVFNKFV